MKLKGLIVSGLILLVSVSGFSSSTSKIKKIDQFIHQCYQKDMFNGTILVAEKGKILYKNALGLANFATKEKMKIQSVFYLASVSKQFTTMAIMMLAEKGMLSYEDRLSKFFPDFPSWANRVTIRHLMNHTSGVPDHFRLGISKPDLTNADVVKALGKQESLQFDPGEKYQYSNGGYVLLAQIVEKVAKTPFHLFLKKNIFSPLGMTHSLVYDESKPAIQHRAIGCSAFGEKSDYNILTMGPGGIFSNIEDLFKWDQALYGEKLIKQKTLAEAFTPGTLNNGKKTTYGFGWGISERDGEKIVAHSGGLAAFRTFIGRRLHSKDTIILLTNNENNEINRIAAALANILSDKPYQLPKIPIGRAISKSVKTGGIEAAIKRYYALKKKHQKEYRFRENELNELGYSLMAEKRVKAAVKIFKLNVKEYPAAWNVYDSLGEAYMTLGQTELAIKNYEKSVQLNPENKGGMAALKKLKGKQKSVQKK